MKSLKEAWFALYPTDDFANALPPGWSLADAPSEN